VCSRLNDMNDFVPVAMTPVVDIAIPVYNEERGLEATVNALHAHLTSIIRFPWRITIVDNASEDSTRLIGARLARDLDNVRCIHVAEKGRGRALRIAWLASVLGQRAGLRIREVPVRWIEDRDSRVDIPSTVVTDLRGVLRMLREPSGLRAPRRSLHAQDPR
jgi:glycosyltransferase involved in cell wall biosynthesis